MHRIRHRSIVHAERRELPCADTHAGPDVERVDAAAVILISPGAELALCDAVLAARFRNGDLALENL